MAAPEDRVQLLKNEAPSDGGTEEHFAPAQLNPNEDGIDIRGLFLQWLTGSDEAVYISRDVDGNIIFRDKKDETEYTLDQLFGSKITSADTTPRYLGAAIETVGISKSVKNAGLDETLELRVDGDGNAPYTLDINPENLTTQGNQPQHRDTNGYSAMEYVKSATYFGAWSHLLRRTPADDITIAVKFVVASNVPADTRVRIAAKIKSRADGEDTSTTWDSEQVAVIDVSSGTDSRQYSTTLTFPKALFTAGDSIALNIGRDGDEEISPTTPTDNYADRISIIAIKFAVP